MKSRTGPRPSWRISSALAVWLVSLMITWAGAQLLLAKQGCPEKTLGPLLDVLHNEDLKTNDPNQVEKAIYEIGRMRCSEAIERLIALLTFRSSYGEGESRVRLRPVYTGTRYPATNALAEIGKPALPPLVNLIETNDEGSLISKNARFAVRSVFHYDQAPADNFFKEAAAKARTPEAKRRLLHALETAEEDFRSD